ncbi:MAG: serine hydrolase domain-containing protein [Bacteroidia bacterium]
MKKLFIFFILISNLKNRAQEDSHVLLTLGLDSVFSKITDKEPGGSIYIQQAGQILYSRSFGLANLKTKEKFTENTASGISSITKTFIAYSILILQKQGQIQIDDSIIKYFPDLRSKEAGTKIKVRHLLTHMSGLPNVPIKNNDKLNLIKLIDKPEFEPGSNYKYSEMDYSILALIIEKISNTTWQLFIQKNIFEPAGMISTKLVEGTLDENTAQFYKKKKKKYRKQKQHPCYENSVLCSVGWSTIGNLRKYVYAIKECVFLDCETLKIATKIWQPVNWRNATPPIQGFSWVIHEEKNKNILWESEKDKEGLKAQIMMYPKSDIMVIWMSNNNEAYTDFIHEHLLNLRYLK